MKIIIWELPEKEIAYLKKNCAPHFETEEICVMTPENAEMIYTEIDSGRLPTKEIILISENRNILAEAIQSGMVTIGYLSPAEINRAENNALERNALENDMPVRNAEAYETEMSINVTGTDGTAQEFPQVDIIVEGFEEADYDFLKKIYQRHHNLPWTILETERLIVRELTLSDMDDLFELYSYEGMTDYMEGLYDYEEEYEYQKAYIENMYRFFGYGMWLVFEKKTGNLIGRAGVEHREELEGELELGYAIGNPWQRKGYAAEVCKGILTYVRKELGFEEICSLAEVRNTVSAHLLEKLGFILEEELILDGISYKKYKKILDIY